MKRNKGRKVRKERRKESAATSACACADFPFSHGLGGGCQSTAFHTVHTPPLLLSFVEGHLFTCDREDGAGDGITGEGDLAGRDGGVSEAKGRGGVTGKGEEGKDGGAPLARAVSAFPSMPGYTDN